MSVRHLKQILPHPCVTDTLVVEWILSLQVNVYLWVSFEKAAKV